MIEAQRIPVGRIRLAVTGGLSLFLHGTLLAGLGALPFERALTGAMQEMEVALVSLPAPASRARLLTQPPSPARTAAATRADTGPAEATPPEPRAEPAFVEARHDVAALHNPRPPYPLAARRQGLEGKVLLRAQVLANGRCHAVQLMQSSGSALLDDAALSAVRRWRFMPATQGGEPVSSWVEVPVKFQLRNASRS